MKITTPPIKSQGIKSKLVPWINSIIPESFSGTWIEPFMGTGVVGFNVVQNKALMCDTNPHLVSFYKSIQSAEITPENTRDYLEFEGEHLREKGKEHFYEIRERFNDFNHPLDFLFINRSGFNGMIRFNRKGKSNVPFCHKPNRFSKAYVTRICNQIAFVKNVLETKEIEFKCQDFSKTIQSATEGDMIYCDPPYIDRHADYYNGWGDGDERILFSKLKHSRSNFILSTWHHNDYRENQYIKELWNQFFILKRDHYYHVGGSQKNRNPMVEALISNFYSFNDLQDQNSLNANATNAA